MSKQTNFTVISSNPSNEGKTFVTKFARERVESTFFGDKKTKETYYVSGSKQIEVGSEIPHNILEGFKVVERPFEIDGEVIYCKWLHLN